MDLRDFVTQINRNEDYYAILGVTEYSSKEQIQTEYKLLALKLHPDKNLGADTNNAFAQVQLAYETLTDEEKRADYDRWRHSGLAISYGKWKALAASRMSVHWTDPKLQNLPIEQVQAASEKLVTQPAVSASDIRSQFRSYQI